MTDEMLIENLRTWNELRTQIDSIQTKMDKIKAAVKSEMDERMIETYSCGNIKVDIITKVTPKLNKPSLIKFLATTKKFLGTSVIPDEFYGKPTISMYPQLKVAKTEN